MGKNSSKNTNNNHHHQKSNVPQDKPVSGPIQGSDAPATSGHIVDSEQVGDGENHLKKWKRRFKLMLCCSGYKRNQDSITDVASLFSEFFSDLGVPSSEIAAGMVLLSKFQAAQQESIVKNKQDGIEQFLSNVPIRADTKFLDLSKAEDSHLVNDLIYYLNYSLAIFGWPLQMFEDPCSVCCIGPHLKWSCCKCIKRRKQRVQPLDEDADENNNDANNDQRQVIASGQLESPGLPSRRQDKNRKAGVLEDDFAPIIVEDNCCSCNWASAESRLEGNNVEIVYITYQSDVSVTPFLVAADHAKQMVVVAIRGSMTMTDVFTDLNGLIDTMPLANCPEDWKSHRGMTRAAQYVKSKLIDDRVLERAFNCRPDWDSQDYGLVLCGHSLGAGVASLLGVLLRPIYPKLRAYLYSPPGGIMSLPVVEHTKEFAIGIILGNDCVARMGMAQFERLRFQVLMILKNSDRSTGKVLAKALFPNCCFGDNKVEYDPEKSLDLLNTSSSKPFMFKNKEIPFQSSPVVMYVPGRIIHIVRNHGFKLRRSSAIRKKKSSREPVYQAIWSDNSIYDRIVFCDNMLLDHMPQKLKNAMKMLFCKSLPDRRESMKPTHQEPPLDDEDLTDKVDDTICADDDEQTKTDNGAPNLEEIKVNSLKAHDIVVEATIDRENDKTVNDQLYPNLNHTSQSDGKPTG